MAYENTNGLNTIQSYGPYEDSPFDTNPVVFGCKRQLIVPLVGGKKVNSGFDSSDSAQPAVVPEGSYITEVTMYNDTAFDAAIDVSVGSIKVISASKGTATSWTAGTAAKTVTSDSDITSTVGSAAASGEGFVVIEYLYPGKV